MADKRLTIETTQEFRDEISVRARKHDMTDTAYVKRAIEVFNYLVDHKSGYKFFTKRGNEVPVEMVLFL